MKDLEQTLYNSQLELDGISNLHEAAKTQAEKLEAQIKELQLAHDKEVTLQCQLFDSYKAGEQEYLATKNNYVAEAADQFEKKVTLDSMVDNTLLDSDLVTRDQKRISMYNAMDGDSDAQAAFQLLYDSAVANEEKRATYRELCDEEITVGVVASELDGETQLLISVPYEKRNGNFDDDGKPIKDCLMGKLSTTVYTAVTNAKATVKAHYGKEFLVVNVDGDYDAIVQELKEFHPNGLSNKIHYVVIDTKNLVGDEIPPGTFESDPETIDEVVEDVQVEESVSLKNVKNEIAPIVTGIESQTDSDDDSKPVVLISISETMDYVGLSNTSLYRDGILTHKGGDKIHSEVVGRNTMISLPELIAYAENKYSERHGPVKFLSINEAGTMMYNSLEESLGSKNPLTERSCQSALARDIRNDNVPSIIDDGKKFISNYALIPHIVQTIAKRFVKTAKNDGHQDANPEDVEKILTYTRGNLKQSVRHGLLNTSDGERITVKSLDRFLRDRRYVITGKWSKRATKK